MKKFLAAAALLATISPAWAASTLTNFTTQDGSGAHPQGWAVQGDGSRNAVVNCLDTNGAIVSCGGGAGGGGGGASTIADGADVAEGATTDAAATQGSTGSVSAKLRTVTGQLNSGNTSLASIDSKTPASPATAGNQTTANTSLASIATNTTGAATAANQTTGNTSAATTATNTGTTATGIGAPADAAYAGSGSASAIAALKGIYTVINSNSSAALPAGTNIVGKVGIDQTTPGTTNATSLSQINAATTLAGNGATGTGSQRVTIASDNSPVAGMGVAATGGAVPANAIYNGVRNSSGLSGIIGCDNAATYDASTSGSTELVALSSSKNVYVCGYTINADAAVNVKLITGTGTACATGAANLTPAYKLDPTKTPGLVDPSPFFRGIKSAVSSALCLNTSGAVGVQATVYYTQF